MDVSNWDAAGDVASDLAEEEEVVGKNSDAFGGVAAPIDFQTIAEPMDDSSEQFSKDFLTISWNINQAQFRHRMSPPPSYSKCDSIRSS